MRTDTYPIKRSDPVQKPDLMNVMEVRAFFGGTRLIDTATLYRGMNSGRYPRGIHVGGVRWLRSECEAALARMIAERDALADQTEDA
jgi:predicted DNA-binding transcriptional regulator AlpA